MKLLAVRHGQASFHAADYDQLSDDGIEQTRALGRWLASHGERFDHVVRGSLRRHQQSLAAISEAYADSQLPTADIDPDFDEFDHRRVIAGFLQRWPSHPAARDYAADPRDHGAVFALLRAALQHWARGELDDLAEPWGTFKQRTRDAVARLAVRAHGRSVLLVSSGGVIAQLAAAAMESPDHRAVELNLTLRNSALSELQGGADGLRLASWNALPHLADRRSMWTYV